jgi:CRP-like cAMP-binding protein
MTDLPSPDLGPQGSLAKYARRLEAGDVLFEQDAPATEVFLLHQGRVRLLKRIGSEERGLCTLRPGDLCGEAALIPGAVHVATAVVTEAGMALVFDRAGFAQVLAGEAALSAKVLQQLARRLRDAEDQVEILMVRDHRARVVLTLLRLAQQSLPSGVTNGQVALDLAPTDLAARTGLEVSVVRRAVQEIRAAGYLTITDERLELTNLPALQELLGLYGEEDRIARPVWSGLAAPGPG